MAFDTEVPGGGTATPPATPASAVPASAGPTPDAPIDNTLQPPAATAPAQAPVQLQPSQQKSAPQPVQEDRTAGQFFKKISHSFAGAIIGSLAGPSQVVDGYDVDENGKQTPRYRQLGTTDKLKRIAQAALEGLAAGSSVPQQKSAAASWASGIGAGAAYQLNQAKQEDLLKRAQSKEQFEQEQSVLTSRAIRASHNATTFATHLKAQQEQNDHDPDRQIGLAVQSGAEDYVKHNPQSSMTIADVSESQARAMREADPNTIGDYAFFRLGLRDVKDANGNLIYETDGVTPKQEGHLLAIGGGRELGVKEGKIPVPQVILDQAKKFEGLIPGLNVKNLTASTLMPMDRFFALTKSLTEAEGRKLDGWKEAKTGDNAVMAPGPDGKLTKMQRNSFDGELRPYGGIPNIEDKPAKEAADIAEKGALTEKAKSDKAKTDEETKQLKDWDTGGPNGKGRVDVFGNPVGAAGMDRKEYVKRVDTYTKDYSKDLNQLDAARSQLTDIITNAEKTKKLPGADAVVGIFDAIGISSAPLKGRGFKISNTVIGEHVEGTRNAWQNLALKLSRLSPAGTGQVVSLNQLKDYERIMDAARHDAYLGAANDAVNRGIGVQSVPRGNGKAIDANTMDIFLTMAQGDAKVASTIARQYGWTPPAQAAR
jgi:hypothetical protein